MEYYERIQRSIDYIDNHLTEPLSIENIAREAFLSTAHLYRIFPVMTGCTVGQYIRKRRLSDSATQLKHTKKRIIDIAMDYQFESQESYIRAFKAMFDITPGKYRTSDALVALYNHIQLNKLQERGQLVMQPNIFTKKYILVGVETRFDLKNDFTNGLEALRETLRANADAISNKVSPVRMVGIWLPDPEDFTEISSKRIYFTGVEVTSAGHIPEGFIIKNIPESLYAGFREKTRGTTSRYAYAEWLPASGYLLNMDIVPGDFEVFDDMFHCGDTDECDILLPIRAEVSSTVPD